MHCRRARCFRSHRLPCRPHTDALIVVPVCGESCRRRISDLAQNIPVVIFNECGDFGNVLFSVHGDGFAEGAEAAGLVEASSGSEGHVLLMKSTNNQLVSDRLDGFCNRIYSTHGCDICGTLDLSSLLEGNYTIASSLPFEIARMLDAYAREHPGNNYNCVYIADGLIAPVSDALRKIGRADVRCFGHESKQSLRHGEICGGCVRTDIAGQATTAIRVLADYLLNGKKPARKEYITAFDSYLIC